MKMTPAGVTVQQITAPAPLSRMRVSWASVGVGRPEGLVHDVKLSARTNLVHLGHGALPEAAGVGDQRYLADVFLFQIVGDPFEHVFVVDRALERPSDALRPG